MVGKRLKYFIQPRTGKRLSFLTKQIFVFKDSRIWDHNRKRVLPQTENNGYLSVALKDDEGKWHFSIKVHDLVATCFIRLLCKGEQVHHVDHCKTNNDISNLEIISASEHSRQHNYEKWENGTFDGVAAQASARIKKAWAAGVHDGHGAKVAAKLRNVGSSYRPAKQVAQLSLDGRLIKVWPSTHEAGRNGFNFGAVARCCRNCFHRPGNNVYKNYVWQWYDKYLESQPTAREQFEARQLYLNFTD